MIFSGRYIYFCFDHYITQKIFVISYNVRSYFSNFQNICFANDYIIEEQQMQQQQLKSIEQFRSLYRIEGQIGRGASAICYKIIKKDTDEEFAMKKIQFSLIQQTTQIIMREINLLRAVSHPNIIKYIDAARDKDSILIVTEYQRSKDLNQIIKQRKKQGIFFSEQQIWKIYKQLLEGLICMHQHKIIHRDIKPSNIFVDGDLNLKIGDLGAAKMMMGEQYNYTRIGTPYYLPPQIIQCDKYSFKADVWSLGVTLYYICLFQLPFQASNIIRLGQAITYQQPSYEGNLPGLLGDAIRDMLMKKEKDRLSASQLLDKYYSEGSPWICEQTQNRVSMDEAVQKQLDDEWNKIPQGYIFDQQQNVKKQKRFSKLSIRNRYSYQSQAIRSIHNLDQTRKSINQNIPVQIKHFSDTIKSKHDQVKQISFSRTHLEDGDQTIVLKVDPNDFSNYSGYYKDVSNRSSKINYDPSEMINVKSKLLLARKSSIFKSLPLNSIKSHKNSSLYVSSKQNSKIPKKTIKLFTHNRQQSSISIKQKHNDLMTKLRPQRYQQLQPCQQFKKLNKVQCQISLPELVMIDYGRRSILYQQQ